jgi:hypothetical protein
MSLGEAAQVGAPSRGSTLRTSTRPRSRSRPSRIDYGAKYPKAVAKIVDDADVLLEF